MNVDQHPVMISSRTSALCLLLAATLGCATNDHHSEDSFQAAQATTRQAVEETDPTIEDLEPEQIPPRLARTSALFGAPIDDVEGQHVGSLRDLLIEPSTGRLVGMLIALDAEGEDPVVRVLDFNTLTFGFDESATPRLMLDCSAAELESGSEYSKLFDGRESSSVSGEVQASDSIQALDNGALVIKLRDSENLLHRVLLEPGYLAVGSDDPLKPGSKFTAVGVMTRDGSGKLLVAKSVDRGGSKLELRDEQGVVLWDELQQKFRSGRALAEQPIVSSDSASIAQNGLLVDWERAVVVYFSVMVDDEERALPWNSVEQRPAPEAWRVNVDAAGLAGLLSVSEAGQVADQL